MTARLELTAARNVPWGATIEFEYDGEPISLVGSTIAMQVRLYPGAPGEPLIDLTDIDAIDSSEPTTDLPTHRVLRLYPAVDEADLAAMPAGLNQPEPGQADRFSYDIVITYSDATADRLAADYFLLEPGVTD